MLLHPTFIKVPIGAFRKMGVAHGSSDSVKVAFCSPEYRRCRLPRNILSSRFTAMGKDASIWSIFVKHQLTFRMSSWFNSNLRFLRRLAGQTQAQLADTLSLKRNNIAAYEAGVAEPNHTTLLLIARYFEVGLHEFIDQDLSSETVTIVSPANPVQPVKMTPPIDFSAFLKSTNDAQKFLDGISALQKLKQESEGSLSNHRDSDFQKLSYILNEILQSNWTLIKKLEEFHASEK
jgi:transcriptional regulator with XRE-family HTH domain